MSWSNFLPVNSRSFGHTCEGDRTVQQLAQDYSMPIRVAMVGYFGNPLIHCLCSRVRLYWSYGYVEPNAEVLHDK